MKAKVGIAVLAVVLAASIVGNVALYTKWMSDVTRLETDNDALKSNFQSQVDQLSSENTQLSNEIAQLKAARVDLIDTYWEDHHPLLGSAYVHVWGTAVNFGKETAHTIVVTVKIYEQAVLLKTEAISLQNILGEWYGKFDVDINYSGDATSVDFSVSYT